MNGIKFPQTYVKKRVNVKKAAPSSSTPTKQNHVYTDSSSLSNISFLNNNNNNSTFLDNYEIPPDFRETRRSKNTSCPRMEEKKTNFQPTRNEQKNDCRYRILSQNLGTFSFKNLFPKESKKHKNRSVKRVEESKADFSSRNFSKNQTPIKPVKQIVTKVYNVLEYDDLTPIPKKRNSPKNVCSDYDYKQAKSAAILIRRLEYSYNLRLTKQYKCYETQIIYIQRAYRRYLERKNQNLLNQLIEEETMRLNYENSIWDFLTAISDTFYRAKARIAFNLLKRKYAQLAKYNSYGRFVNKIIRAYRNYATRKKRKTFRKLKGKLTYFSRKLYKMNVLDVAKQYREKLNKIIHLQQVIRSFLLRKREDYILYIGRKYHPELYYRMKYRNNKGEKFRKLSNFYSYVRKWKSFVKKLKDERILRFSNGLKKVFYREFWNIFMTQLAKKVNSQLTYILLKPRIQSIEWVYYRGMISKRFNSWKIANNIKKKKDILGINIIQKIIKIYYYKPTIKGLKKRKFLNDFIRKFFVVINNGINRKRQQVMNLLHVKKTVTTENIVIVRDLHLKHFVNNISYKNLLYPFLKWKSLAQSLNTSIVYKKKDLKFIVKEKKIKNYKRIVQYFYKWRKQIYLLLNYQTKIKFIFHYLKNIIVNHCQNLVFESFENYNNKVLNKKQNKKITIKYEERLLKIWFIKWKKITQKSRIDKAAERIGKYLSNRDMKLKEKK